MSLDINLITEEKEACSLCGREFEPVEVFSANITHNLTEMAEIAGIYKILWRPEELGIVKAGEIIESLEMGLKKLKANPKYYQKFDSSNGWGTYKDFVPWVEEYLEACIKYPDALIAVSR